MIQNQTNVWNKIVAQTSWKYLGKKDKPNDSILDFTITPTHIVTRCIRRTHDKWYEHLQHCGISGMPYCLDALMPVPSHSWNWHDTFKLSNSKLENEQLCHSACNKCIIASRNLEEIMQKMRYVHRYTFSLYLNFLLTFFIQTVYSPP